MKCLRYLIISINIYNAAYYIICIKILFCIKIQFNLKCVQVKVYIKYIILVRYLYEDTLWSVIEITGTLKLFKISEMVIQI